MFSGREMAGRKKMLNDLKGIGEVNVSEKWLKGLNARVGELPNRIAISDKIAREKLTREKK